MKRLILICGMLGALIASASAQHYQTTGWQIQPPAVDWGSYTLVQLAPKFAPPQAPENQQQPNGQPPPVIVNPPANNTVVTTTPDNKINELPSWGTVLGGIVTSLAAIFIPQIVSLVRTYLATLAGPAGAVVNGLLGDRFDKLVQNGMFKAIGDVSKSLDGKLPISDKSLFQRKVAEYVQEHGVELITKLGGQIGTSGFFDAINARVEKNLINPDFPISIDPTSVVEDHKLANSDDLLKKIGDVFGGRFEEIGKQINELKVQIKPQSSAFVPSN